MKFFFETTLGRDWEVWGLPLQKRVSWLPTVLTVGEVHEFVGLIPGTSTRSVAWTLYETGARLFEALALRPSDVDSERQVLRSAAAREPRNVMSHWRRRHWRACVAIGPRTGRRTGYFRAVAATSR